MRAASVSVAGRVLPKLLDDISAVPMGFPNHLLAGMVRGSLFGGMRERIKA